MPSFFVFVLLPAIVSTFLFLVSLCKDVVPLFSENWQELIQKIKSKGMRPGVTLKLGTPMEEVYPLVDGGLGPSTIDIAASVGANCIVAGSSIFGAPEPTAVIYNMQKCFGKSGEMLKLLQAR
ncbi:hypothetical protein CRYUN_Cryun22dG0008300 [Craigia yunnanensis]